MSLSPCRCPSYLLSLPTSSLALRRTSACIVRAESKVGGRAERAGSRAGQVRVGGGWNLPISSRKGYLSELI